MVCRGCKKVRWKFILLTEGDGTSYTNVRGVNGAVERFSSPEFSLPRNLLTSLKNKNNKIRLGLQYTEFENIIAQNYGRCARGLFIQFIYIYIYIYSSVSMVLSWYIFIKVSFLIYFFQCFFVLCYIYISIFFFSKCPPPASA